MSDITIKIGNQDINDYLGECDTIAPLYDQVGDTTDSYPAWLEVRPEKGEAAIVHSYDATVPEYVWSGRAVRIPVSAYVSAAELRRIAGDDKFRELIETVIDCYGPGAPAGSRYEAEQAIAAIEHMLYSLDTVTVWDAADWFDWELHDKDGTKLDSRTIADMPEDELRSMVQHYVDQAASEDVLVVNVDRFVDELRAEALGEAQ